MSNSEEKILKEDLLEFKKLRRHKKRSDTSRDGKRDQAFHAIFVVFQSFEHQCVLSKKCFGHCIGLIPETCCLQRPSIVYQQRTA